VPAGTARLRLAFTAAHSHADIDGLLEALDDRALARSATA
jgi:7-keto-8-aminopelargonate synthetase-like enzyme